MNSSLKRLKSYFRLTDSTSVTSFLFPWAIVLCLVGGILTSLSGPNASYTLAHSHYNEGESSMSQHARVLTGSIVIRTSDGIYQESVVYLN